VQFQTKNDTQRARTPPEFDRLRNTLFNLWEQRPALFKLAALIDGQQCEHGSGSLYGDYNGPPGKPMAGLKYRKQN